MKTITCPKCEAPNPVDAINCRSCQVNFALHYPEFFKKNLDSDILSKEKMYTNQLQSPEIPVNDKTTKIVVQIIAFVIGTFVFTAIFSDSNAVTYADLIMGAAGGSIAWGIVGRLFKDEPTPENQSKDD